MSSDALSVAVIICAYTEERWDDLVAAVASVRHQTRTPQEIIVVIDHNPALLARARTYLPEALVIANTACRGLAGARNTGVAAATSDVIAFLDDDAQAAPDWLAQLLPALDDPRAIGAGGAVLPVWAGWRPWWFPAEFDWVVGCTYRGMPRTNGTVRNLIGANMAFRREVLLRSGGFREGVGQVGASLLRCDDTEFCIRTRQQWPGAYFAYRPEARVFHRVPTTRARWAYFRIRCYTEGLAKAQIASLVGADAGLSAERTYTLRALPAGVARGVADAVLRGDPAGLGRAAAIVAGLALTAWGYLVGTWQQRQAARDLCAS